MKSIFLCVLCVLCTITTFAAETGSPVTPDQALTMLKTGNQRSISGTLLHPHQDAARRAETAKGQAPFASILACSDSRAALDTIFDSGIGDLFTIRVAGNVADTDEIASLEYGAEHLHTPLIVVLGHSSCGAVTAVVKKASLDGQLPGLLDNIQAPAARALASFGTGTADLVDQTARENVQQSIQDMLSRSKILAEMSESGKLKVVGAFYHLDTGVVDWLDTPAVALQSWQDTGLKSVASPDLSAVPTKPNSLLPSLYALFASIVVLGLFQKLFVSQTRWIATMKIKARMTSSYIGIVLVLVAGAVLSVVISDPLPVILCGISALLFMVIFTNSHFGGIKTYIHNMRK